MTDIDISAKAVTHRAAWLREKEHWHSADMLEALAARIAELVGGAIDAIRNPSPAMIEAARKKHWELCGCQFCAEDYANLFRAMVDVAPTAFTDPDARTLLRERDEALGKVAELERERDERNERARRKWSEVVAKHEQDLRDFHVTVNEHQAEIAALAARIAELERERDAARAGRRLLSNQAELN